MHFVGVQLPALMEMFVWLVVVHSMKGEWRCVSMEDGEECVLADGLINMLKLCAESWDFHHQVRTTNVRNLLKTVMEKGVDSGFREWAIY